MAGRRVRWAPEPLLLTGIIVLVILWVWLDQWGARNQTETTVGLMLFQVGKLLLPFMAATFVLPDRVPEEGPVDLYAHYDRTRALTFGALIIGLVLFWGGYMVKWASGGAPDAGPMTVWSVVASFPWEFCLGYGLLIVVRRRWFNIALLAAGLVYYGWQVVPVKLAG